MIVECPHCFTRVLPKAGGICPGCGKDTNDISDADISCTSLIVSPGMPLPSICIVCGAFDAKFKTVRKKQGKEAGQGVGNGTGTFWLAGGIYGWLIGMLTRSKRSVVLEVPVCPGCTKDLDSRIKFVNFETGTITFIVNRAVLG